MTKEKKTWHSLVYDKNDDKFGSWTLREKRSGMVLHKFIIFGLHVQKNPTKYYAKLIAEVRSILGESLCELRVYTTVTGRASKTIHFSGADNANTL